MKSHAVPLLITTNTQVNAPINPTLDSDTGIYNGASNYGDTLVTLFKDGGPVGYYLSKNGGPTSLTIMKGIMFCPMQGHWEWATTLLQLLS